MSDKRPHLHVLLYEALRGPLRGGPAYKDSIIRAAQHRCADEGWRYPNSDNLAVRLREMARAGLIEPIRDRKHQVLYRAVPHPDGQAEASRKLEVGRSGGVPASGGPRAEARTSSPPRAGRGDRAPAAEPQGQTFLGDAGAPKAHWQR